jgi:error-prone DNA polymerase
VEVRPPHVNKSQAKCTIEPSNSLLQGAVRIGLEYVTSIGADDAQALARAAPFESVVELAQRTAIGREGLESLIASGACDGLGSSRRALLWELGLVPRSQSVPGSGGVERQLALPLDPTAETPELAEPTEWEEMLANYRRTSLSVDVHPMELIRPHLPKGVLSSHDLCQAPDRSHVAVAGMAVARQRPSTANGVVFMLLEDEFGQVNLIVPPQVYERHRAIIRGEPLILARGVFERVERNQNVVVRELETLAPLARKLSGASDLVSALPDAHHFGHR